jgi:hypothetical protein
MLQVNPQIYQDEFIKTQKDKRQLSTGSTAALIRRLRQIYLCKVKIHPSDRIKINKNKKEHYTGSQDLQFLLNSIEWRC